MKEIQIMLQMYKSFILEQPNLGHERSFFPTGVRSSNIFHAIASLCIVQNKTILQGICLDLAVFQAVRNKHMLKDIKT